MTSHYINLVNTVSIFINNVRIKHTTPPDDPCDFTETCEKQQPQDAHAKFILVTLIDTIHYINLENKKNQKICVPSSTFFLVKRVYLNIKTSNDQKIDC